MATNATCAEPRRVSTMTLITAAATTVCPSASPAGKPRPTASARDINETTGHRLRD